MRIYIPSIGRVGSQITYNNLPPKLQRQALLVIPQAEAKKHGSIPVLVHPAKCKTIGPVRQFIIDQHDVAKYGLKIIMLDDDLTFFQRRTDDSKKFTNATPADIVAGFKELEALLSAQVPHGGIRHREMAQDAPTVQYATRALRALAYHVGALRSAKVRFDRSVVMEDFDVTLQLLRMGLPNAVYSDLIQNQVRSNAPGGCSTYRTMEKQREGALTLKKLHSDFVKVVEKTTKTAWGGGTRTDVVVSWKKALASGVGV